MSEPILDPTYWAQRLASAPVGEPHHAVMRMPLDRWLRIEAKHREILSRLIDSHAKVLDVGCGYGRLLYLLPHTWVGAYIGVDISPAFVTKARLQWPIRHFIAGDIRNWERSWGLDETIKMDWAVLISMRPMVRRNCGDEVWDAMEREVRKVARKLLYLEYDENDEGSVE